MHKNSKLSRSILLKAGVIGVTATFAFATQAVAEYPTKPITIVAPYGAGGASDLASRTMASVLPSYIGQPVLVVNRTGAGGVTGSTFVNKSKPDGYTLLLARIGSQSVSPAMKANIPYKYDDFTMLAVIELNPVICATSSEKPYKTMKDLVDAVKAKPGELSFSSAGVGSMLHVAVPLVLNEMGVENPKEAMNHVPYKGGGNAATAAVGGHVDLVCTNSSALAGHIAGGKLRPGMEPAVADKLRAALQKVKEDKAWNKFTKALGSVPYILDGPETKAFVDKQFKAFNSLVEKLGMKIE